MGRNAKDSEWYSTPQAQRKRKQIVVMLSDAAREKLDRMSPPGQRSATVERLIMEAKETRR